MSKLGFFHSFLETFSSNENSHLGKEISVGHSELETALECGSDLSAGVLHIPLAVHE